MSIEQALELEPSAAYALNNLCYGWMLAGRGRQAVATCQHALSADPDFAPARNNLALAFAVAGDISAARRTFAATATAQPLSTTSASFTWPDGSTASAVKAFEAVNRSAQACARQPPASVKSSRIERGRRAIGDRACRPEHRTRTSATASLHPDAPTTMAEAGLSQDLVTQLMLKLLHFGADPDWHRARAAAGAGILGHRAGRSTSSSARTSARSSAVVVGGPSFTLPHHRRGTPPRAAVPRAEPVRRRRAGAARAVPRVHGRVPQSGAAHGRRASRVREAFSHLVISDKVLDQVGPAIAAGHSMFVYGPPGNGKTVIAQAIRNLLDGEIAIPHAIEVEGQIIRFFDPVNHEPIPDEPRPTPDCVTSQRATPAGCGAGVRW